MELSKEYEAIIARAISDHVDGCYTADVVREAVERCYALANKPPRELTDEEIVNAIAGNTVCVSTISDVRAIIAAHERKQREPETVTFRAARSIGSKDAIAALRADMLPRGWEWLEPEQSFEVVLP